MPNSPLLDLTQATTPNKPRDEVLYDLLMHALDGLLIAAEGIKEIARTDEVSPETARNLNGAAESLALGVLEILAQAVEA